LKGLAIRELEVGGEHIPLLKILFAAAFLEASNRLLWQSLSLISTLLEFESFGSRFVSRKIRSIEDLLKVVSSGWRFGKFMLVM